MAREVLEITPEDAALVKREESNLVNVSASDFMPLLTVAQAVERKSMVNQFIGQVLREGEDYGPMPGDVRREKKKVLLKPGAEKLSSIFGLCPTYQKETVIEDWTGADHGGEPLFYYEYRCVLSRGGKFAGEAIGSCNSWESKYRYRWVTETAAKERPDFDRLPKRGGKSTLFEFQFALEQKQTAGQYGKPMDHWDLFDREIAAGRARRATKTTKKGESTGWEIDVDTTLYRVPNPDVADIVNTCQKIAQKRALVAAVLVVTNCSDAFTQDMDDFAPEEHGRIVEHEPDQKPEPEQPKSEPTTLPSRREVPAELQAIFAAIDKDGARVKEAFTLMQKQFEDRMAANTYQDMLDNFRQSHPKGSSPRGQLKDLLLDMWEAVQKLDQPF